MSTRVAAQSGNWNLTSTWTGGVVPTGADIADSGGFQITVSDTQACAQFKNSNAGARGKLIVSNGGSLTLTSLWSSTNLNDMQVDAGGTLIISKVMGDFTAIAVINGTFTINGTASGNFIPGTGSSFGSGSVVSLGTTPACFNNGGASGLTIYGGANVTAWFYQVTDTAAYNIFYAVSGVSISAPVILHITGFTNGTYYPILNPELFAGCRLTIDATANPATRFLLPAQTAMTMMLAPLTNLVPANLLSGVNIGGVVGTDVGQSAQLATDVAAVDAQKANIVTGTTILTKAGSYPTTATSQAAQLATDQAAVEAVKAHIRRPADGGPANVLGTVVGTLNAEVIHRTQSPMSLPTPPMMV